MATITDWTVSWPWPKIYFGEFYNLAANLDSTDLKLYELTNDGVTWDATEVLTFGTAANISAIDIIDFGRFYIATCVGEESGEFWADSFVRRPAIAAASAIEDLPQSRCPVFSTGCNFNGQIVVGGLNTGAERWLSIGQCSVAWSAIGRMDFRPDKFRTAGFRGMPWDDNGEGKVHKVRKLGKGVMVYGDRAKAYLIPFSQEYATGFGFQELAGAGIASPNHIAGDSLLHCYLDTNNDLWLIDGTLKMVLLGYREFMNALGSDIHISYIPQKKRFYISDGSIGYVLTEAGLSTCHQCVTSAGVYRGQNLCGFFIDNEDYEMRAVSGEYDFGFRGLKQARTMSFDLLAGGIASDVYPFITVDRRLTARSSWSRMEWRRANHWGFGMPMATANDFRFGVKLADYRDITNFNFNDITVEAIAVDKRAVRGQYANKA
jgi:hypothetical protein